MLLTFCFFFSFLKIFNNALKERSSKWSQYIKAQTQLIKQEQNKYDFLVDVKYYDFH